MHAHEAPIQTDSSFEGERSAPTPHVEPDDAGDSLGPDEEETPEEAGYGYGV